jgi:hypothetical protein
VPRRAALRARVLLIDLIPSLHEANPHLEPFIGCGT